MNTQKEGYCGISLIASKRTVKLRDEGVKEFIKVRSNVHARYTSSETTVWWAEYAKARKYVKYMKDRINGK